MSDKLSIHNTITNLRNESEEELLTRFNIEFSNICSGNFITINNFTTGNLLEYEYFVKADNGDYVSHHVGVTSYEHTFSKTGELRKITIDIPNQLSEKISDEPITQLTIKADDEFLESYRNWLVANQLLFDNVRASLSTTKQLATQDSRSL